VRATALKLESWTGLAGLEAQRERWESLLEVSGADALCNAWSWNAAYARAHLEDEDIFGWTALDADGSAVGLLPMSLEPKRGAFALRRALFLGDGTFDSDYLEPLARPGAEDECAQAFLEALCRSPRLDVAVFSCIPLERPWLDALSRAAEASGLQQRHVDVPCCSAALPEDFESYLKGLKSRMRSKVRSAVRGSVVRREELLWTRAPDELDRDLAGLFDLHTQRWRTRGEPGSFADTRRTAFYADLARRHLEQGTLRLARLERDGRPIAYQIGLVAGDRYYQLQEGFDPALEKERPGVALRARALAELQAEGVRHYDFMAGVSRHKTDWGAADRMCRTLSVELGGWRAKTTFALKDRIEDLRGR